ncbi:MAG: hypothetical protein K0S63_1017 [Gammaproteobacteria bacterium]|jgi:cation transport regulator|nr:hypothetical protein [Gammaproteobacteria bacterium]
MPYKSNKDLPDAVREHLPKHAQDIYRKAFNNAHNEYSNPKKRRKPTDSLEEVSHRVAWKAVKQSYKKGKDGDWHPK